MDKHIVLTANSVEELNQMINKSLEKGFLIKGETYPEEDGQISQIMTKAKNIDRELVKTAYLQIGFLAFFAIGTALLMM